MGPDSFELTGVGDLEHLLLQAKTGPEILDAVARLAWSSRQCTVCPDDMVPSEQDLHMWWETVGTEITDEANQRLNAALAGADDHPQQIAHWDIVEEFHWGKRQLTGWQFPIIAAIEFWTDPGRESASIRILTLAHVHTEWLKVCDKVRHPLAPLVTAWQEDQRKCRLNGGQAEFFPVSSPRPDWGPEDS